MKKLLIIAALLFAGFSAKAIDQNDSLGLPGDNLDLFGVLDLFKQSSSLEDFEKKLNDPANELNNLDLNGDDNVDYIRVVDRVEGDAHAIVLQVPVSESEAQDVAAIELEKTGAESADLQIVGDEELYGEDYIVEAKEEAAATDAKFRGFSPVVVVNVWMWPAVRYVYAPAYVVWVSPYRWAYYPSYWRPWRPVGWRVYHPRMVHYHVHYGYGYHYRMSHAHGYYHNHRVASNSVHQRYEGHHQRHAAAQGQRNGSAQKNGNAQKGNAKPQQKGNAQPQQKHNSAQKGKGQPQQKGGAQKGKSQPQHKQGGRKPNAAPRGGRK